jgi:tetratricopeptide (TPR) repeat protein
MRFSDLCKPAVLLFTLCVACNQSPDLAREHLRRGDAALADGRYAQALAAYGHARDVAPADPDVQRGLMRARAHLIAERAARINPEAFEDARYEASFLLETDKARAPVYLTALGNILARQGDSEGAKAKFAEALKLDPSSALAHAALGIELMKRSESAAQAKAELELALKSKPADFEALVALGQLQLAQGDAAGAAPHLEAALKLNDDFEARMALGNARARAQKTGEAIQCFQRAVELNPKSAEALSALGKALLSADRPADAERALTAATQLQPDQDTAVALGYALQRQKKAAAALNILSRVLAEDPSSAPALYGAGAASEELGKKDQAIEYYQRLSALPPGGPDPQLRSNLQREAQVRLTALAASQPSPQPSASASASAGPAPSRTVLPVPAPIQR